MFCGFKISFSRTIPDFSRRIVTLLLVEMSAESSWCKITSCPCAPGDCACLFTSPTILPPYSILAPPFPPAPAPPSATSNPAPAPMPHPFVPSSNRVLFIVHGSGHLALSYAAINTRHLRELFQHHSPGTEIVEKTSGGFCLEDLHKYRNPGTKLCLLYTGHSSNSPASAWPLFFCQHGPIPSEELLRRFQSFFRTFILIVSCCNDEQQDTPKQEFGSSITAMAPRFDIFRSDQSRLISASARAEFSYGSPARGSFFIDLFKREWNGSWTATLDAVSRDLQMYNLRHPQIPQMLVAT